MTKVTKPFYCKSKTCALLLQAPTLTGLPLATSIDDETLGGTTLPGTFTCDDSDDTMLVSINPNNPEFSIDSSAAPSKSLLNMSKFFPTSIMGIKPTPIPTKPFNNFSNNSPIFQ